MGTKTDPGHYDCYAAAAPDEPMFVLLARDPSSPGFVRSWAALREREIRAGERPKSDQEKVANARRIADEMERWAAK